MANPIEKDEDRSLEEDITEWFEEAFEKIKGAFYIIIILLIPNDGW